MRHLALILALSLTVAIGAGVIAGLSAGGGGGSSPQAASAAGSRTCTRIGRIRYCFRTTAAEIAEALDPLSALTGYGPPGDTGIPPGIASIRVNTPSVPGGQITCTNAGTEFDCQ